MRGVQSIAGKPAAAGNYLIEANFHVYVSQGEGKPDDKRSYSKGMVVEASDIPEGHAGDDWVAKGLAKAV